VRADQELRSCLIDEGFVLWLGLGDPHFYKRYAVYPILKGMGQNNLRRAQDCKKGAHGKVVEGPKATDKQRILDEMDTEGHYE
jgi:hypothetical protein